AGLRVDLDRLPLLEIDGDANDRAGFERGGLRLAATRGIRLRGRLDLADSHLDELGELDAHYLPAIEDRAEKAVLHEPLGLAAQSLADEMELLVRRCVHEVIVIPFGVDELDLTHLQIGLLELVPRLESPVEDGSCQDVPH